MFSILGLVYVFSIVVTGGPGNKCTGNTCIKNYSHLLNIKNLITLGPKLFYCMVFNIYIYRERERVDLSMCIYIYIYIYREREREAR